MYKIVFMFPGQGAQYIGMGKEFYETFSSCKKIYQIASTISQIKVEELCFEENALLNITEYTQIAMLTTEIAIMQAILEAGIEPNATCGLSLGEYGAIVASKVLTMEDAFRVIRERGKLMQQAVPSGGAMAAILGMDVTAIERICNAISGVSVANYNCPGQIVITGETKAVEEAMQQCKDAGARRCMPLKVSGPFHSPMLEEAGKKLEKVLDTVTISSIKIPYITNVTADYVTDERQVKNLLEKQVASSVKWQQTIEKLIADDYNLFIEIGPGKTLSGFMKKINPTIQCLNIEKVSDLEKLKEIINHA